MCTGRKDAKKGDDKWEFQERIHRKGLKGANVNEYRDYQLRETRRIVDILLTGTPHASAASWI